MNFTAEKDANLGDKFLDISKTEKRLVRITSKTYQNTGSYFFLKIFKKNYLGEFSVTQRLTLSSAEFDQLLSKFEEINQLKA